MQDNSCSGLIPSEMSTKTFLFEILTLEKVFFSNEVRFVVAPGLEGSFEILAGHAPYVFALQPGALHIRLPDGSDQQAAVGSGFLVVQKDRTTALVRSAEFPKDIDVDRARRAKGRAETRLEGESSDLDRGRAKAALRKANARLKAHDLE